MRNAMRELLKNAKANAFENPAHPCPWEKKNHLSFTSLLKATKTQSAMNVYEKKKKTVERLKDQLAKLEMG